MEALTKQPQVTDRQLQEAEQGLRRLLLAKRFHRGWVEEYVPEIMAQARSEFAARLAVEGVTNTVNLLVVIGYRRAMNLARAERSRPQSTSLETVLHLADEDTPTPEEEALDHDRQLRIVEAMGHLPERERKLLALVYFEDMPLGQAGRRLGWAKASATRHHQAALERLRLLIGDRKLLSPEIAIPAYAAARHHSAPRAVVNWLTGTAESLRDTAMLGGSRAGTLAETGNAAALSGAGRTAAGVCAVAVGTCLAAATGVVGPGVAALGGDHDAHRNHPPRHSHPHEPEASGQYTQTPPEPTSATATAPPSGGSQGGKESARSKGNNKSQATETEGSSPSPAAANGRSTAPRHTETVNEFGVEQGEAESVAEPKSTPPPAAARPVAPAGSSSSMSTSSGSSRGSSSAGTEARAEVGM